ncbi:hypothetical protein KY314_05145 [Candidatus Woesearchaeota archaeon]|nr:hypothetical protein [Candidatus Woesearchaeota archaeon]
MTINQVFNQIWNKVTEQDNVVVQRFEENGERIEVVHSLDGKRIAMRGPARLWQNKEKEAK